MIISLSVDWFFDGEFLGDDRRASLGVGKAKFSRLWFYYSFICVFIFVLGVISLNKEIIKTRMEEIFVSKPKWNDEKF